MFLAAIGALSGEFILSKQLFYLKLPRFILGFLENAEKKKKTRKMRKVAFTMRTIAPFDPEPSAIVSTPKRK